MVNNSKKQLEYKGKKVFIHFEMEAGCLVSYSKQKKGLFFVHRTIDDEFLEKKSGRDSA